MINNNTSKFRDGLIDLNTRQFGTSAEVVIKILKDCIDSKKLEFDLIESDRHKIEVKASKVFRGQPLKLNVENFYELIIHNSNRDRLLSREEIKNEEFDCNIQQIKTKLFDKLVYLLFFKDVIEIFEIDAKEISDDKKNIRYSDKQHRGNKGEGQFHINNTTYNYHKKRYFIQAITYEKLMTEAEKYSQPNK